MPFWRVVNVLSDVVRSRRSVRCREPRVGMDIRLTRSQIEQLDARTAGARANGRRYRLLEAGIVHCVIRRPRFVGDHGQVRRFLRARAVRGLVSCRADPVSAMAGIWLSRRLRFPRGVRVAFGVERQKG
jgi:hypothetical protein